MSDFFLTPEPESLPLEPGSLFSARCGVVRVMGFLGRGKSGYSHLVMVGERLRVLKVMHDEPCAFYDFGGQNKTLLEVQSYHRLRKLGVPLPKLLEYDAGQNYLIKEYVEGPTGARWWARGSSSLTMWTSSLF